MQENRIAKLWCKMTTGEWRTGAEGGGEKKEKACPARAEAVGIVDVTEFGFALERGCLPKRKERPVHMQ